MSEVERPECGHGGGGLVPPSPLRNGPVITSGRAAQRGSREGRETAAVAFRSQPAPLPPGRPLHGHRHRVRCLREALWKVKPIKMYLMALPNDLLLNKREDLALALQDYM